MRNTFQIPQYMRVIAATFGLVLFIFILILAKAVLIPFTFSLIFAFLLHPLCKQLEKWHFPPPLAAIICIIIIFTFLGGIIFFVFVQLSNFAEDLPKLQEKADEILNTCMDSFEGFTGWSHQRTRTFFNQSINNSVNESGSFVGKIVTIFSSAISTMVIIIVSTFFLLYYRVFFRSFVYKVFRSYNRRYVKNILLRMQNVVQNYILGLVTVITIIAALNSIGLLLLGIKYAIFFGILAALLNILPYIGVLIGSLLPMVYALITKDSIWYTLGVGGVFWGVQILEANLITPNIVGSKVSLNPFAAIFAIIIGEQIWGIPGMILAIPILAISKVIFDIIGPLKPIGFVLGEPGTDQQKKKSLL